MLGRAWRRSPSLSNLLGLLQDTVAMAGLGDTSVSKSGQQGAQQGTKSQSKEEPTNVRHSYSSMSCSIPLNVCPATHGPLLPLFIYPALFISAFPYSHLVYCSFHQCIYVVPFSSTCLTSSFPSL